MLFGSAEFFMLSLFGLSMVGVPAGRILAKGPAACCIGLALGSVGGAAATGRFRRIFAIDYFHDGVPLAVVGLGLFAFPEIVDLLSRNQSISGGATTGAGGFDAIRDWSKNRFLSVRRAGVGCIVGTIPGPGGSVADWIAHGHAVQTCKDASQVGKGEIRGVIAPERQRGRRAAAHAAVRHPRGPVRWRGSSAAWSWSGSNPGRPWSAPIWASRIQSSGRRRWPTCWGRRCASRWRSRFRG